MKWLNKIKDYLHRNEQHTFVYCPKCGSLCSSSLITTWDGAMQSWVCPCCGWSNLNVETKVSTSTENIDLGRVTTSTEAKT